MEHRGMPEHTFVPFEMGMLTEAEFDCDWGVKDRFDVDSALKK